MYNKYTQMLFQACLHCNNAEFKIAIKEDKMKWIQDKLKYDYLFADLLKLGWITFNNLVKNDIWVDVKEPSVSNAKED